MCCRIVGILDHRTYVVTVAKRGDMFPKTKLKKSIRATEGLVDKMYSNTTDAKINLFLDFVNFFCFNLSMQGYCDGGK